LGGWDCGEGRASVSWRLWTPQDAAGRVGCLVLGLLALGAVAAAR